MKDPRKVGETWRSDYWGQTYKVLAVGLPTWGDNTGALTVLWADGHTTTHGTAVGRDVLVYNPSD